MENTQEPSLTSAQRRLLRHLQQREAQNLPPASLDELCAELGLASRGSLHKQVAALVEYGLVQPMQGKQRGVRLNTQTRSETITAIPLLGRIAAGRPIAALEEHQSIDVPVHMLPRGAAYALQVQGDSMRDLGILDGDTVLIEARDSARSGEVVVALIDEAEATLKRLRQRGPMVELLAENPDHPSQHYRADQVRVQGVLVGLLRSYR